MQGRIDDNITTMKKRLKIFNALNRPVIDYYKNKGKLYTVSSLQTFMTSSWFTYLVFWVWKVEEAVDNV
jgi:adenylate kinase family enzyme